MNTEQTSKNIFMYYQDNIQFAFKYRYKTEMSNQQDKKTIPKYYD